MSVVNLVDTSETLAFPLTQTELAGTTGMTTVHVNRSLQTLRKDGLIRIGHGRLTILDFERLAKIAGFNKTYLPIDGPPFEPWIRTRLAQPM